MSKTKTKKERRDKKHTERKKSAKAQKIAVAARPTPRTAAVATPKVTTTSKAVAVKKPNAASGAKPGANPAAKPAANTPKTQVHQQQSQVHQPFGEYDNILLVGEGDFSFTRSLCIEHGCANVTGTSYDAEAEVREKYPTFSAIEKDLRELTPPVPIHHSIDATKLSSYKALRAPVSESEPFVSWDIIGFQFPHTGGLSTDVNRQVRANQALLVSFFDSCLEKKKSKTFVAKDKKVDDNPDRPKGIKPYGSRESGELRNPNTVPLTRSNRLAPPAPPPPAKIANRTPFLKMGGKIIVTLFENEPYTLWNIRDLARHAGLKVLESWKFDWEQYPGYKHVRTLGAIEGGGAWKGEDRVARMYVFEKIEAVVEKTPEELRAEADKERERKTRMGKRKRGGEDPLTDSEDEEGKD